MWLNHERRSAAVAGGNLIRECLKRKRRTRQINIWVIRVSLITTIGS